MSDRGSHQGVLIITYRTLCVNIYNKKAVMLDLFVSLIIMCNLFNDLFL